MEVQPREIRRYITSDGRVPFTEWFDTMRDRRARTTIKSRLDRVSQGNLKNVKMQTSDSYRDYLISSLKEPEESAMYIEVTLEEGDPKLLNLAVGNVVEAHQKMNNLSEKAKLHYQNLNQMLLSHENSEIYTLVALLNEMGFRLEVKPKEIESSSS